MRSARKVLDLLACMCGAAMLVWIFASLLRAPALAGALYLVCSIASALLKALAARRARPAARDDGFKGWPAP